MPTDNKTNSEYVLKMLDVAKDKEATERYLKLTGQI